MRQPDISIVKPTCYVIKLNASFNGEQLSAINYTMAQHNNSVRLICLILGG
jgi:hypothetical protein